VSDCRDACPNIVYGQLAASRRESRDKQLPLRWPQRRPDSGALSIDSPYDFPCRQSDNVNPRIMVYQNSIILKEKAVNFYSQIEQWLGSCLACGAIFNRMGCGVSGKRACRRVPNG
jgi:hypothetical protein